MREVEDATCVPGWIVRCGGCGMWFKRVTGLDSPALAYGDEFAGAVESSAYMDGAAARGFFRRALQGIEPETGTVRPRLLDIGSGTGTLLEEAAGLGYRAEGIELSERLAERAREKGLQVRCLAGEELDATEEYDVVTMMDLIEHVTDPLELLRRAFRSLKPGGELVVYTPNHGAAVVLLARLLARARLDLAIREIFGRNHVCFFDAQTLVSALNRAEFELRRMWRFPYDPRRPGGEISLASLALVSAVEWMGRPFGRVFRMVAFARRPLA
ncbi:MAG: class I SAM-dependent methyltransferase [Planctomycetota bacterium]